MNTLEIIAVFVLYGALATGAALLARLTDPTVPVAGSAAGMTILLAVPALWCLSRPRQRR